MLNKPIDEIVMENGKVVGVKSEGEVSSFISVQFSAVKSSFVLFFTQNSKLCCLHLFRSCNV